MHRTIALLGVVWTLVALTPAVAAPGSSTRMIYPPARAGEVAETFHGVSVRDPYRWLEALDSAETRAWVDAQNRLANTQLALSAEHSAIRKRIAALADAWPSVDVPVVAGERRFFLGLDVSGVRPVLFVQDEEDGESRLLLDPASLGEGATLTAFEPAPNGKRITVTIGKGGSDWGEIRVLDVDTGKALPGALRGIRFSGKVQWARDARGFLYRRHAEPKGQRLDAAARDAAVYRHRVGTAQSADVLVYAIPEADALEKSLDLQLSDDRRRLFLNVERGPWLDYLGGSHRQVSVLDVDESGLPAKGATPALLTSQPAAYRVVATIGTRIYVMTDLGAPRRRVVTFDLRFPEPENWKTVVPETEGVLESVHHLGGRLVGVYLENVHAAMRVFDMQGRFVHSIALPDLGTVQTVRGDPRAGEFRFMFGSFLSPPVILRHDLATRSTDVESRGKVAVDASRFETEQRWFASKDGTRIPMFVVHRRGIRLDGSHPTLLYGYGASGDSSLPGFSEDIFAWLEMGGIYAVANVRGGGEFGKAWYEAAILDRKQTSFDDFIAAAEHMIAQRFTSPAKLAIRGASNGGLLVTAAMTQRPELFAAVLADVPVTDALRRSRSATGAVQTAQWGSTADPKQIRAMLAYSPLHNVAPKRCYPATLITTSRNDDRLPAWHAYKFAAALQSVQDCNRPIVLHVRESGAHGGATDLDEMFDGMASAIAFAARHLGLKLPMEQ